jgi:hypothetical protein
MIDGRGFQTVQAQAREYFAAPDGSRTNDGSIGRPLDLTTALSAASPARAGDIIWLRGGTYRGAFLSVLTGTATAPIIVRQYPGERATIDSASTGSDALTVRGANTWFWGLEITSSDPKRVSGQSGSWPSDLKRGYGAVTHAPGIKFINMVLHDNANGIGLWTEAIGSEAYGNLIYYNGWQAPDRAHGHGIYTQNQAPTRRISENILFDQFSHGIHAYGSDVAALDNITLTGNVSFMNGAPSIGGIYESGRDLLLGGWRVAANPVIDGNVTYTGQSNIGYGAGCANGRIANNYFAGPVILVKCDAVKSGNTFYDENWPRYGTWPTQYPANTYHTQRPSGAVIKVRPNAYEPGRSHVVVLNWGQQGQVAVDLSGTGLAAGTAYEVRDAQNFFDRIVASGTYNGSPVSVPLTGLTAALPVGNVPNVPAHTAPEFAVFIVVPKSAGGTTPPVPPTVPPATIDLRSSVASITAGQSATLTWTSTGASSVSVAPGVSSALAGTATVTPAATTTYVARATNSAGQAVTDSVTVTVATAPVPPTAPTVRITAPQGGARFVAPAAVVIDAAATGQAGAIARVRFFVNGALVGEDTTAPYRSNWNAATAGTYTLTAQAMGASSVLASSSSVAIVVSAPTTPPTNPPTDPPANGTVQLSAPLNNAVFLNQSTIPMTAVVADAKAVAKVEFYRDSTLIDTESNAPFTGKWASATSGTYVLTARAHLKSGGVSTSAPINVRVTAAPAVRITAPLAGTYAAGTALTITATATDADGTVAKVEFYRGTTLIGQTTAAPYAFAWTGAVEGTHQITAKAYDNLGATTTSPAVSVTLNAAPVVRLTSPLAAASYANRATVTIEAAASDAGGSIQKVEFFRNGVLIGAQSSSPYRVSWSNATPGTHTVTAKAYDNKGSSTMSAPVIITVRP